MTWTSGLAVAMCGTLFLGAPKAPSAKRPAEEAFEVKEYKDPNGKTLPYRMLKPEGFKAADKHPLLIVLHGAGERGSDNKAQLKFGTEMMLAAAKDYGAFVIAPQCPKDTGWTNFMRRPTSNPDANAPTEPMRLLLELIASLQKEFSIDADRLYVTGLSMGGFGSWYLIQQYPDMFAAASPICGAGEPSKADRIANVPVWAFHGGKDNVVPPARSREMIEAIKKAGGSPKYTEYPDAGHNSWDPAFKDPELLKWMMAQNRAARKTAPASVPAGRPAAP